ncbi:site-specific integrase [Streptomyces sp. MNU76]|uniref:site-specific integrase n=1 Tax=Streptomyces sp. MNU76 TaxID=2560026 RepID=UPI001E326435|nr:site-specific integrase [Streptomyces sp. MNU76]MCC9706160.1 site-specific integrase [Streptomyces sp. MNU76]
MTTTRLAQQLAAEEIPPGTQWPTPDTRVLVNRDLRPETDLSQLSRFRHDHWDLNPAVFADHSSSYTLNFKMVPAPLRLAAKHYAWQLLNHTEPPSVRGANGSRIWVTTIATQFNTALKFVLDWFAGQGVTAFCQVTNSMLDAYLIEISRQEGALESCYRKLTEVRRLWAYRSVLPASMRLPQAPPWDGEDTGDLLGRTCSRRENRTRRIGAATMEMLLAWAIRFVEDFAEDILAGHAEHRELMSRTPDARRAAVGRGEPARARYGRGGLKPKVAAYLAGLRERGETLPGRRNEAGNLEIDWRRLAAILGCSDSVEDTGTGRMITESGVPIGSCTYLDAPVTGLLDGVTWRTERITHHEAPQLARLLSTACLIIIAYLSGARVGEVLNLRRGCVRFDADTGLWLMEGLYFKGATDQDGNVVPEGKIREDPWVIIELVARAITLLERLHFHTLLFPTHLDSRDRGRASQRRGQARTTSSIVKDLAAFVAWVNAECARRVRTDAIPDDGRGRLTASRFRRTLAWFIRRRPRGLIAASIQYGHLHTRILQGYADPRELHQTGEKSQVASSARRPEGLQRYYELTF